MTSVAEVDSADAWLNSFSALAVSTANGHLANVCYTRTAAVGGVVALGHVATAHVEDRNAPFLRARGMGNRALTPHTSSNGVSATGDGWSDTWNTMTSADAWR